MSFGLVRLIFRNIDTPQAFLLRISGAGNVEREFSNNKIASQVNVEDINIVAKEHVIDHMGYYNVKPEDIKMDKPP